MVGVCRPGEGQMENSFDVGEVISYNDRVLRLRKFDDSDVCWRIGDFEINGEFC